ncbi:hypothetical protein M885DRAFT_591291 [Pelagophyceae sp. CCMP2097]|nr:hypothetical protein M885DRAFT_591291 [Pelagophyceae sp. CCMP2097]
MDRADEAPAAPPGRVTGRATLRDCAGGAPGGAAPACAAPACASPGRSPRGRGHAAFCGRAAAGGGGTGALFEDLAGLEDDAAACRSSSGGGGDFSAGGGATARGGGDAAEGGVDFAAYAESPAEAAGASADDAFAGADAFPCDTFAGAALDGPHEASPAARDDAWALALDRAVFDHCEKRTKGGDAQSAASALPRSAGAPAVCALRRGGRGAGDGVFFNTAEMRWEGTSVDVSGFGDDACDDAPRADDQVDAGPTVRLAQDFKSGLSAAQRRHDRELAEFFGDGAAPQNFFARSGGCGDAKHVQHVQGWLTRRSARRPGADAAPKQTTPDEARRPPARGVT